MKPKQTLYRNSTNTLEENSFKIMENHHLKVFTGVHIMMDWAKENLNQNACPVLLISMTEKGNPIIQSNIPKEMLIQLTGKIHDELIKDEKIITIKKH